MSWVNPSAIKRLQEVLSVFIGEKWIVKFDLGNTGKSAEQNIFQTGLGCRGYGYRIAVTTETGGNP
jgi:hypothetical protein